MGAYWVTETMTWKIYADSEDEARNIWRRYQEGESWGVLDMKLKGVDTEGDWDFWG